jgi:hypothetical protein
MRRFLAFLLLAPIAIAVTWAVAYVFTQGVDVTIINNGPAPLSDVVVHVVGNTGSNHRIGALPVGEARSVRVSATGKAHVEVSFADAAARAQRLNAGGYLCGSERGTIEIELENGAIKRNDQDVKLSYY